MLTGMQLFLIEDGQPISTTMDYQGITVLEEHVDQVPVLVHALSSALWFGMFTYRAGARRKCKGGGAPDVPQIILDLLLMC